MRILQVITSLRTGGAERLVVDLSKQMRLGGNEVEILLFDGTETPLRAEAEVVGIPVHALSKGWRAMRNPLLLFKLMRVLRRNRYDVIHTHNTACQLLLALASCLLPLRIVTTEHSTDNNRRRWKGYQIVDRWMYARYRRIICVGESARQALDKWLDRPDLTKKLAVIPNGIDVAIFAIAQPAEELSLQGGHKILMVSAFRAPKDHSTLIRAMQKLSQDYSLYLAGGSETDEDRKYQNDCRQLVAEFGLGERVRFLGIRSDVPQLLAAADAVVLSTAYEGMSLSLLESMAAGRPLIASDVPGVHDLVSGAGLLFPFGDDRRLAELIRQVCEDPSFAAGVGAKCRARAADYDVAETARRYLQEYAC